MTEAVLFRRRSPIVFGEIPAETEGRDGFRVVLRYEHEGGGPFLIDISHRPKWSIHDRQLSRIHPYRMDLPEIPNTCTLQNGFLFLRLTEFCAHVWHLFGQPLEIPSEFPYIDIAGGEALLALMGRDIPAVLEKAAPLDLRQPQRTLPSVFQGPVFDVPCILSVLEHSFANCLVLLACGRSYGQSMAENLLKIGEGWGMRPAGERMFTNYMRELERPE